MPEASHKMHTFIQALYGVVIGVTSLKLIQNFPDLSFYKSIPSVNSLNEKIAVGSLDLGPLIFKFCFLGFTLVIAAHDWYSYHSAVPKTNHPKFWVYVYPIASLFFLAQMLLAASENEMTPWYVAGLFYTFFNWRNNKYYQDEENRKSFLRSYPWHVGICLVGLFTLWWVFNNYPGLMWLTYGVLLVVTATIVIWQWSLRPVATQTIASSKDDETNTASTTSVQAEPSAMTYKRILGKVNTIAEKQLAEDLLLYRCMLIMATLALLLIGIACWFKESYRQSFLSIFGNVSLLGSAATAVYLLLQDTDIRKRNNELLNHIQNDMKEDPKKTMDEFMEKVTQDRLTELLNEKPKSPFKNESH